MVEQFIKTIAKKALSNTATLSATEIQLLAAAVLDLESVDL